MANKKLYEILNHIHIACSDKRTIKGISDHTQDIQEDYVFIVRHMDEKEARIYINEALCKGAVVLCVYQIILENVYVCENLEEHVLDILTFYYGDVCSLLCVIGITGTSGKTSVASLVTQLLEIEGNDVIQIGTGFVKHKDELIKTHNTTPGCFQLANIFYQATQKNVSYIVMEVSSHAIDQNRINFIHYDMILYTNIAKDHLDYHFTSMHYRYTKFKLRKYLKKDGVIIYNADEKYFQELTLMADHKCISFGRQQAHFPIRNINLSDHDIAFHFQGFAYKAKLLGIVNVYNVCEAMIVMRRLNISYERLQQAVSQLRCVDGRMEIIHGNGYNVWLDYAHSANALEKILQFAYQVKEGKILTVIGCGGNRDRSKRPTMAEIAAKYSDIAIFTSDNPRYESVYSILEDMQPQRFSNVRIFENRLFAIKHTIKIAQKSDIIIIAGKGNEETMSVRGEEYLFSDRACIIELLNKEETKWK